MKALGAVLPDAIISADANLFQGFCRPGWRCRLSPHLEPGKLIRLWARACCRWGLRKEAELSIELRYSSEPYLLAIMVDGTEERLPVEAVGSIDVRAQDLSQSAVVHR